MTGVPSNYDHRTTEISSTSLPTPTLIGIILGVVVGVCLVVVVGWLLLRRHRKQQAYDEKRVDPPSYSEHGPIEMDANDQTRAEMEANNPPKAEMEADNLPRAEMAANNPPAVFELDGTSPYTRGR